jgi:hypothetical protein
MKNQICELSFVNNNISQEEFEDTKRGNEQE